MRKMINPSFFIYSFLFVAIVVNLIINYQKGDGIVLDSIMAILISVLGMIVYIKPKKR